MRLLLCLLLSCRILTAQALPDPFPEIAAAYRVEIDGRAVWEREADRRLPPASLTKLMTALLATEQGRLQDIVVIGRAAARESGSRIGLGSGERFRAKDLLAAALIASANDACHALADHVAGSEARFVQMMNRRAQQLGMRDTRFANACGHDAPAHHSSARDLALLAREALKHPEITALTAQPEARIATPDGARSYLLTNRNALIGRYPGALGLKTGYTAAAGKCLVAHAERNGTRVLLVMLRGNDRWWDAADILDLAFDHARAVP